MLTLKLAQFATASRRERTACGVLVLRLASSRVFIPLQGLGWLKVAQAGETGASQHAADRGSANTDAVGNLASPHAALAALHDE